MSGPEFGIPSRDLHEAREAYKTRDIQASRRAHAPSQQSTTNELDPQDLSVYFSAHPEPHLDTSGESVKAIVFGGLDGVVTIFAIVAGCVGARISPLQVIMVGVGNLLADAFSMGFGEYVSSKAEGEYIAAERKREEWEIENCPEGEKGEMIEIYQAKYGITYEDASQMIDLAFKYPKFFLYHMMVEELGLKIDDDEASPFKRGVLMFTSFGCFGLIPLLGFVLFLYATSKLRLTENIELAFAFTCFITLVTLFILGVYKARFSNQNAFISGLIMTINGAVASTAAYGSGAILQHLLGEIV
eukprot:Protomagalhaensia_sp_Gyna_25__1373@NODE_1692_length_1615_cov_101_812817_g1386_i0_p1_GENE_NODE_1692_length_1615_cov_101_812817_g1386_i0NODE_1692_length_1615_cov_101_812817_g1386_i0_p1_ORF_typecomplete_len301_score32_95VIT1/PF01988_19/3e54GlpM/PF06942_12/2_3e03GlpM/PF06942_12/0_2GlpM/PF06942_12/1_2e03Colicin_im/PF03857_13/0_5RseC_MucC/PF04246_12/6_8e03RseC_MucC/PF04246_12/6_7e03RseC_MucC/PF04246_12/0_046Promethin/PF16015_5/2_2e03Promethin/PF16015_5/0_018_NODE_1692_length_1615_cov_101_812817_g1386_